MISMILNTQWIPVDVCPVSHSSIDWKYPTWYYIILFWIAIAIANTTPPHHQWSSKYWSRITIAVADEE